MVEKYNLYRIATIKYHNTNISGKKIHFEKFLEMDIEGGSQDIQIRNFKENPRILPVKNRTKLVTKISSVKTYMKNHQEGADFIIPKFN